MTKRHYNAIAKILANELAFLTNLEDNDLTRGYRLAVSSVAHQLVTEFENDNPRFNRDTFLQEVGIS